METAKRHQISGKADGIYGDLPMIQSTEHNAAPLTALAAIDDAVAGKVVVVRARLQSATVKGNLAFLVLRQNHFTIQATAFKSDAITKDVLNFIAGVSKESIVEIEAEVKKVDKEVKKCSISRFELQILKFYVINRSHNVLPFQLEDASRKLANKHDEYNENVGDKEAKKEISEKKDEQPEQKKKAEPAKKDESHKEAEKKEKKEKKDADAEKKEKPEKKDADGKEKKEAEDSKNDAKEKKEKKEKKDGDGEKAEPKEKKDKKKKDDAGEEENSMPVVKLKTRLNARVIDFRTPANQAIFRIQSAVCRYFREFLYGHDFIEIHTPKMLGGSSEGGANVFKFDYFGQPACLAQSPQLYKQMMVMGDFTRVFEIGPVFRAEHSNTHRHLTEFTGLDIEMAINQSYYEIMDIIGNLFTFIFKSLEQKHAMELKAVNDQYEFEPFLYTEKPVIIKFEDGVKMLHEAGVKQAADDDLSTETERELGKIVREKFKTDFYILHRYPQSARPFYTMLCKDDPNYTCSYDVFMRGEEIISGAQRVHDPDMLTERAIYKKIPVATIKDYIDSFKFGAYPHGGFGVGLERVVMLYLDLGNIRKSSAFPRDPSRITP